VIPAICLALMFCTTVAGLYARTLRGVLALTALSGVFATIFIFTSPLMQEWVGQ
jgi:hypothetical protein